MSRDLLSITDSGLFCEAGGFHIDPWKPVDRAIITHAHTDHARPGSRRYCVAEPGSAVSRLRLGESAAIQTLRYGEPLDLNGVRISFHPAGHVLGSAQIRVEDRRAGRGDEDRVWVVTGDYKRDADPTCAPFEPVACDVFITESTFGLPVYRWESPAAVLASLNQWWHENRRRGMTSVVFAYPLGKAQRVLAGADPSIGPILTHGAVSRITRGYEESGVAFPSWQPASPETIKEHKGSALVIAPPSARNSPWLRRFQPYSDAMASGWMRVRGTRRRQSVDRGFTLSDHADWPALLETIRQSGARRVGVTHGYTAPMVRWLQEEMSLEAWEIPTRFEGEADEPALDEGAAAQEKASDSDPQSPDQDEAGDK